MKLFICRMPVSTRRSDLSAAFSHVAQKATSMAAFHFSRRSAAGATASLSACQTHRRKSANRKMPTLLRFYLPVILSTAFGGANSSASDLVGEIYKVPIPYRQDQPAPNGERDMVSAQCVLHQKTDAGYRAAYIEIASNVGRPVVCSFECTLETSDRSPHHFSCPDRKLSPREEAVCQGPTGNFASVIGSAYLCK